MTLAILTDWHPQPGRTQPTSARPVRAIARNMKVTDTLPAHQHDYGQLTCTLSGVIRVTAAGCSWIVPPQRAIWIPPHIDHEISVLERAQLRPVVVHRDRSPFAGAECTLLEVTPLMREAIIALGEADSDEGTPREALLGELILDEASRSATRPIRVPLPRDKRLYALCAALVDDPSSNRTLADWARQVGASERTLARLFEKDLGISFGQWRQQVRLAHAVPLIARGAPLARVAGELGYASQSAFTAMFKKTFGVPPTVFFAA